MMRLLIVREGGEIRVTVTYGSMMCDQVESRTFRRFSHRAWGFVRRAMAQCSE